MGTFALPNLRIALSRSESPGLRDYRLRPARGYGPEPEYGTRDVAMRLRRWFERRLGVRCLAKRSNLIGSIESFGVPDIRPINWPIRKEVSQRAGRLSRRL